MQKHVPLAVGAKLQAELMTALASVIPAATAAASDQLVISIAQQLASDLDSRLLEKVKNRRCRRIPSTATINFHQPFFELKKLNNIYTVAQMTPLND
jgi:hypothetical protein